MNQREPTSAPRGAGQTFPCLALLLLPLLSGGYASAHPQPLDQPGFKKQKTYLVALGPSPLRFQEPVPAAALAIRPPGPSASRLPSAEASGTPSEDVYPPVSEPTPSSNDSPLASDSEANPPTQNEFATSTPTRSPQPILPDDARPQARPEDFLPFFQIPVTQPNDVNVIVPGVRAPGSPAPMPYSSATYRQVPR